MNTNPDETKLAMWLDDELNGTDLAEMETWAETQPEQIAARDELRNYKTLMSENIPASEDPPYPDFFVTRVNQGIRELEEAEQGSSTPTKQASGTRFWKSWLMPIAACAGMILAFSIGRQSSDQKTISTASQTSQTKQSPLVYTPEEGVAAEWVSNSDSIASLIVLRGISAIPDSTDFSETVYVPTVREADRTATLDATPSNTKAQ